ncbi:hypothetical protein T06_8370 [Trichinella sp. T6]|nr:hypothetical protein T06_8370 [Trichinella sp. T6]
MSTFVPPPQVQESGSQFTCPYEGSKLHFETLSKVKIVRMLTLNIVTS